MSINDVLDPLNLLKVQESENNIIVYHGTNHRFTKFNFDNALQRIIWFSSDKEKIIRGESGAQGNKYIMTLQVRLNNPAGWDEYDRYSLDELYHKGFDGVILPDDDNTYDGFVFDPEQIKILDIKEIQSTL